MRAGSANSATTASVTSSTLLAKSSAALYCCSAKALVAPALPLVLSWRLSLGDLGASTTEEYRLNKGANIDALEAADVPVVLRAIIPVFPSDLRSGSEEIVFARPDQVKKTINIQCHTLIRHFMLQN